MKFHIKQTLLLSDCGIERWGLLSDRLPKYCLAEENRHSYRGSLDVRTDIKIICPCNMRECEGLTQTSCPLLSRTCVVVGCCAGQRNHQSDATGFTQYSTI